MHTDTQIQRPPDDVLARHDLHHDDPSGVYRARHRHRPGPVSGQAATVQVEHFAKHGRTELIPVVDADTSRIRVPAMRLLVPARRPSPRPVPPVVLTPEPVAEVTVGLLERVVRRLKGLR